MQDQSVTGTATDAAGNTGEDTVAGINIDKTAPSLSGAATRTRTRPAGTTATSRCTGRASDALSGLDGHRAGRRDDHGRGRQPLRVRARSPTRRATRPTTTVGGIKIDRTAPTTTVDVTELPASGWYTGDVNVTLHSADNLSGVAKTYYKVDGGAAQDVHATRSATA